MQAARNLKRGIMEEPDPAQARYDQRLNRLIRINDQIAELQRRPADDQLAARLIDTLRREDSSLRLTLQLGSDRHSGF